MLHANLIHPAFLTSLRSNLHLSACPSDSPYSSLVSTPTTTAFSSTALLAYPTPSPLSISTSAAQFNTLPISDPLPTPVYALAAPEDERLRTEALRLVGDSVAQQRQLAAKALVLHPYSVATTVIVTGLLARYCSLQLLFAVSTTLIVTVLAALYWITRDYSSLAAKINSEWLENPQKMHKGSVKENNGNSNGNGLKKNTKAEDPIVLVSRLGDEVIGALVLRVVKKERKGYIRAWTVDSLHRGNGIGIGLLQEGVRVAWGKGARSMEFDAAHANAHHALPPEFNGSFEEQEVKAKTTLTELLAEHRREKSSR